MYDPSNLERELNLTHGRTPRYSAVRQRHLESRRQIQSQSIPSHFNCHQAAMPHRHCTYLFREQEVQYSLISLTASISLP